MERKAFTLIELLMVILIMGILGTVSVGGYRAMQRGMEERGVMENVNHFIRAAYRRAQTDRSPTAIFYWNETLRDETDVDTLVVVGKAVAVRRAGRVSRFVDPYLYDEFADLDKERLIVDSSDEENENADSGSSSSDNLMPIYKMNAKNGSGRSLVSSTTKNVTEQNAERLLSRMEVKAIPCYAYVVHDKGSVGEWRVGDAYGLEFAEIQLPHGYIFGSSFNRSTKASISIGEPLWFDVSVNTGSGADGGIAGASTIQIYNLRPGASGDLEAKLVAATTKPTEDVH